jgi:long-chain acyl-CoA synthetase
VIQTCGNIRGNIAYVMEVGLAHNQNKVLNFLPLAHTYGCTLDFLSQISNGSHITFLNKVPAPKVLLKAFEEVKPNVIFTVPLIVEKFYRAIAEPVLKKHADISENILEKDIYPQLKEKLLSVFGGKIRQVVVGGAPLNGEIEENLLKLKFPLAVGYGMTECSPLISFANHDEYRIKAVGKGLPNMEVRIDSEDPLNIAGEIIVKGQNVMPCYFKNEKATEAVFDKDGWFHTGDIGIMKDGYIYIKGRCKSMILGPSGQNIYPEPLEAKLSNMPFVAECLIVEKCCKLVALVYPDIKAMDELNLQKEDLTSIMEENRKKFNSTVANYEQLSEIILYPKEFEKTPKKNIKRYLYENRN